METHLGTNLITWIVIFPILTIAVVGLVWYILKTNGPPAKKMAMIAVGFFAFVGFSVIVLCIYYHSSPSFATTFRFYAYSTLAPKADPFLQSNGHAGDVLIMREVRNEDGRITLINHPNPESPIEISIFTPGKYIQGQLLNDVLTIPQDTNDSLPRIMKTSLWWALTKNIYSITGTVN